VLKDTTRLLYNDRPPRKPGEKRKGGNTSPPGIGGKKGLSPPNRKNPTAWNPPNLKERKKEGSPAINPLKGKKPTPRIPQGSSRIAVTTGTFRREKEKRKRRKGTTTLPRRQKKEVTSDCKKGTYLLGTRSAGKKRGERGRAMAFPLTKEKGRRPSCERENLFLLLFSKDPPPSGREGNSKVNHRPKKKKTGHQEKRRHRHRKNPNKKNNPVHSQEKKRKGSKKPLRPCKKGGKLLQRKTAITLKTSEKSPPRTREGKSGNPPTPSGERGVSPLSPKRATIPHTSKAASLGRKRKKRGEKANVVENSAEQAGKKPRAPAQTGDYWAPPAFQKKKKKKKCKNELRGSNLYLASAVAQDFP